MCNRVSGSAKASVKLAAYGGPSTKSHSDVGKACLFNGVCDEVCHRVGGRCALVANPPWGEWPAACPRYFVHAPTRPAESMPSEERGAGGHIARQDAGLKR